MPDRTQPMRDLPFGSAAKGFRQLVEAVRDYAIFMLDPDGNVVTWNSGARLIKGYEPHEIIGKHFSVFYPPEDVKSGKPARELEVAAAEGRFEDEGWRLRKDGTAFWANVTITSLRDAQGRLRGFGKVARDLTERRKIEQVARENLALFQRLFEFAPDAMVGVDSTGKVLHMNLQAEATFGYPRGEIIGKPVEVLIPERFRGKHITYRSAYVKQPRVRPMGFNLPLLGRRRDGTEFPVDIMLSPLEMERGTAVLAVVRDITERRVQEEQEKTRAELQEKEKLLKEIHHRVKNNLQVITSLLSLQGANFTDKRGAEMFHDTQERVSAIALIHEKLYRSNDLASIDFGDYLRDLVAQLSRSYGADTRGLDVRMNTDRAPFGLDAAIPCGLLINELVSNAIKYAYPSGTRGEIDVEFRASEPEGYFLRVADQGAGLPPTVDIAAPSTLGLQLVNALVAQLGGNLTVQRNRGTTFEIRFPFSARPS